MALVPVSAPVSVPPARSNLLDREVVSPAILLCAIPAEALTLASVTDPAVGFRASVSAALFAKRTACPPLVRAPLKHVPIMCCIFCF